MHGPLLKMATEDQLADTFTKGVVENLFVLLRNELMGWDPEEEWLCFSVCQCCYFVCHVF